MPITNSSRMLLLSLVVMLATGCATVKGPGTKKREAETSLKPSSAEAVQAYEKQRADALYLAASSRGEEGNLEICEKTLHQLLTLQPSHKPGRLMLAELYLASERFAEAQRELTELLRTSPNDAQVHHSMGLLLEAADKSQEALEHLEQAVRLEPENELYALSFETLCSAQKEQK